VLSVASGCARAPGGRVSERDRLAVKAFNDAAAFMHTQCTLWAARACGRRMLLSVAQDGIAAGHDGADEGVEWGGAHRGCADHRTDEGVWGEGGVRREGSYMATFNGATGAAQAGAAFWAASLSSVPGGWSMRLHAPWGAPSVGAPAPLGLTQGGGAHDAGGHAKRADGGHTGPGEGVERRGDDGKLLERAGWARQ
jgi:hypothetical protein